MGPNEVQLSDMVNQFLQVSIPDTWKKECSAIKTKVSFKFFRILKMHYKFKVSNMSEKEFFDVNISQFRLRFFEKGFSLYKNAFDIRYFIKSNLFVDLFVQLLSISNR